MGKWISRGYKRSHTSASPQASFHRGRWIWIPIRKRIVHIQVICYKVSAHQIPFLQSRPSTTQVICRKRFLYPRLKCGGMKWQVAVSLLPHYSSFFSPILPPLTVLYWRLRDDLGNCKQGFQEHLSQPNANGAWWNGRGWVCVMKTLRMKVNNEAL